MSERPLSFLIADDHAVVRRGVREMLTEQYSDATFGEAPTAEAALELAHQQPWDLIVLDISMPGRSGIEILQELKEIRPEVFILVQSMHAEDQFALRVLKGGADGYITKDSLPKELIQAVSTVLAGRRYVSATMNELLLMDLTRQSSGRSQNQLSERELQVMKMLARGLSVTEIGSQLGLSIKTISTYRSRVMEKLSLRTNVDLARYVDRMGLNEDAT